MKFNRIEKLFSMYLVRDRSVLNRYGVGLAFLLSSFVFIYFFQKYDASKLYSLTLIAIILSVVHGGLGPAIMNCLIGAFVVNFVFRGPVIEHHHPFFLVSGYWVRFVLYLITSLIVTFLLAEIRKVYKASENSKMLAELANTEKDALLRMIVHDLRNPLGVIMGYSDLLNLKDFPADRVREIAQRISATTLELTCLIDNLVKHPVPENTRKIQEGQKVRVDKLLSTVVQSQAVYAARKGISVDYRTPDHRITVKGDIRKLARVFQNLLDNAIKYSPPNSAVRVEVYTISDKVQIRFIDRGPGIHSEDIEKLFKPLSRTRNQTSAKEHSSGMGLSIVKALMDEMRGHVEFKNNYPRGSSFTLTLPLYADAERDRASEPRPASVPRLAAMN